MDKKIIMIVDDELPICKVVSDVLTQEDYEVVIASSGEEALEKLKKTKPNLILIDFFMPGMSGRELCEKIRADSEFKDLKVAFITAASFSQSGEKELKNMNVLDYIKKPFDNKDLVERVRKIVE